MKIGLNAQNMGRARPFSGQCTVVIPVAAAGDTPVWGEAQEGLSATRLGSAQTPPVRILEIDQEVMPRVDTP